MDNNKTAKPAPMPKLENLTWEAAEAIEYDKKPGWYVWLSIIGLALAGVFIWLKQYLSAGVVVLALLVLFTQAKVKPKKNKYILDPSGLTINEKKYPFTQLKSFSIIMSMEGNTLYVQRAGKFVSPLAIFLGATNPRPIEAYLKRFIPENENLKETTADKVNRILRF